jgi:3-dehydroquinate synthase
LTTRVEVDLGERSYPIFIGPDVGVEQNLISSTVQSDTIVIISNDIVAPLYLSRIRDQFNSRNCLELILPDGEAHKTLGSFERIMTFMLEHRVDRSATIVALGGGVIGDLAGFAAASYQRGIAFAQIPTTLLAQVDSAVGGKTAVNHPLGKNMIGAFYQPCAVFADTRTLATLPDRELSAGLAEVIKYGLIRDREFLKWIDINLDDLLKRDDDALTFAVQRSCENKAVVVHEDEREQGNRAILNLGHTFGHAIETAQGYGNWLHGEAVGAGTCMALRMSHRLGWLDEVDMKWGIDLLKRANLPTRAPRDMGTDDFMQLMARDKKNIGGKIRLVLLTDIGAAVVTGDYDAGALSATLAEERARS